MDCEGNFNDPWCFCFNSKNQSVPQYKQFNANNSQDNSQGIGFHCCHITHYDPSFIAKLRPNQGIINTAIEYLTILNETVTNDVCDYNLYLDQINNDLDFKNKFLDLYNSTEKDRIFFNSFYNKNNTIHKGNIPSNNDLVPNFSNGNVICPNINYIPYYLKYEGNDNSKYKYMYICYPKNTPFPNIDPYYNILFFFDKNNNNCKNNNCNFKFSNSPIGLNAGDVSHSNKSKHLNTSEIIGIVISCIIVFVIILTLTIIYTRKK